MRFSRYTHQRFILPPDEIISCMFLIFSPSPPPPRPFAIIKLTYSHPAWLDAPIPRCNFRHCRGSARGYYRPTYSRLYTGSRECSMSSTPRVRMRFTLIFSCILILFDVNRELLRGSLNHRGPRSATPVNKRN